MRQRTLALVLIGTVFVLSGCVPFRKKKIATGPPPVLPPPKTATAPGKPEVPPPPPKVESGQASPTVPAAVATLPDVPGPPKTKKPGKQSKKTVVAAKPVQEPPAPASAPPAVTSSAETSPTPPGTATAKTQPDSTNPPPASTPAPVTANPPASTSPGEKPDATLLADFLTNDQRARLLSDAVDTMARARKALGLIEGKPLSNEQQGSVDRVKTFLQQAEQARERDPQTALQLAQRADVLARDLARTVAH